MVITPLLSPASVNTASEKTPKLTDIKTIFLSPSWIKTPKSSDDVNMLCLAPRARKRNVHYGELSPPILPPFSQSKMGFLRKYAAKVYRVFKKF